MKNIKKFLIVILAIIAMFSFSMFFACDCGGDDTGSGNPNTPSTPSNPDNPDNPDDPGTNPDDPGTNPDNPDDPGTNPDGPSKDPNDNTTFKVIYFENTAIDVVVGEEKYITVKKGDVSSNLTVKYSSSNESVVSVDKLGKITANAKGSAIITAQVNDFKTKCTVNVSHGNYKPSLVIDNLANNTFVVPANTTYGFNPYVVFNGKVFNNATITVEAGEGISASVVEKNGLPFVDVTAGAIKGNYDLTVKASWDGVSNIPALTKTINVKVIGEVKLYVTDLSGLNSISSVTIYNSQVETLNGLTSKNAEFKVVAENTTATPTVEIADTSIATYNATTNQIEGTGKLGSTTATVSVTNADGEVFSLVIPIECKRAVGDYMNSEKTDYLTVDFSTILGDLDVNAIFGTDVTLTDAYHGRQQLKLDGNKIVGGIDGTAFGDPEPIVITVYDATVGYNVQIKPYVYSGATEYADNYMFSAYDGKLFDDGFVLADYETIFGAGATIKEAYLKTADGQTQLVVTTDRTGVSIMGIDNITSATELEIAIASDSGMYTFGVTAYTLILDEMQDFDYFYVPDGTWSYKAIKFTVVQGMNWNGHYVLANDIDARDYYTLVDGEPGTEKGQFKGLQNRYQYTGSWAVGQVFYADFAAGGAHNYESRGADAVGLKGVGLTGLFDGRGHVIANYEPAGNGGLFQTVNGGVVKNLGFTNFKTPYVTGCLASSIWNGAQIENIFVEVDPNKGFDKVYAAAVVAGDATHTVKWKNVVAIYENTKLPIGNYGGMLQCGGGATAYGAGNLENVIYVSNLPFDFTKSGGSYTTYWDAKYVDGIEQSAANTTFGVAEGAYRYSTVKDLLNHGSELDLSSFDPSVWTILDGGLPIFTSALYYTNNYDYDAEKNPVYDDYFEVYVGDTLASDAGNPVPIGKDTPITVRYKGATIGLVDSLTVVDGNDFVTTNSGYNVNGSNVGLATIDVTYTVGEWTDTKQIKVWSTPETVTSDVEYYYSSGDGKFFEMVDGKLVEVTDIIVKLFGDGASYDDLLIAMGEGGKALTIDVANQGIIGGAVDKTGYKDTCIEIFTPIKGVKLNVKSAGLIIDEVEDLAYFTLKEQVTFHHPYKTAGWNYIFAENDANWNGYFVLADNLDATGYVHDLDNNMVVAGNSDNVTTYPFNVRNYVATRLDYLGKDGIQEENKLLTGTFDGQGYVISNLTTTESGLFGAISGEAVVKNLGLVNSKVQGNKGGVLAYSISQKAALQDIYVLTDQSVVGAGYAPLVTTYGENVVVKNVIVEDNTVYDSTAKTVATNIGSLTKSAIDDNGENPKPAIKFADGGFTDYYIISEKPLSVTIPKNVSGSATDSHIVDLDAAVIDGALNEAENAVAGIKRYTSANNMRLDANNDFSSFTGVWEILNGVPKFSSALKLTLAPYVGENVIKNSHVEMIKGDKLAVSFRIDGVEVDYANYGGDIAVTIDKASGLSLDTDGKTLIADAVTDELSIVTVSNTLYSYTFTVDVKLGEDTYAQELILSAKEGKFFDADFNKVSVDDIFGADVDVVKAYNAQGEALTVDEDDNIFGVTVDNKDYFSTKITLYTADKAIVVNVKSVALVIDEVEDLSFFTLKEQAYSNGTATVAADFDNAAPWSYSFAEDDFYFDGYYVLAKDLDATGYTHNFENGKIARLSATKDWTEGEPTHYISNPNYQINEFSADRLDYLALSAGMRKNVNGQYVWIHGFVGTFDGNGHTISNLTTANSSGLFGVIGNNAVIKNVGFVNNSVANNAGGFLAWAASGGTSFNNVYVQTNSDVAGNRFAPLATTIADSVKATNLVIVDNTKLSDASAKDAYYYGSLNSDFAKDGTVSNGPFSIADGKMTNVIIVSDKPLSAQTVKDGAWNVVDAHTIGFDAASLDGVANTLNAASLVNGVKRYTSIAALQGDATANAEILATFGDAWTVENGVPKFNSAASATIVNVKVGDQVVSTSADVLLGSTVQLALVVNGTVTTEGVTANAVVADGATALVTIDGLNVTAGTTTGKQVVELTYNGKTYTVTLNLNKPDLLVDGVALKETAGKYPIDMLVGDVADVTVTFKGEALAGVTLATDGDVVAVNGTQITASSVIGSQDVTVTLGGLSFVITVNTKAPVVTINGAELDGDVRMMVGSTLTVGVAYNGNALEGFTVATNETTDLVTIENGVITANKTTAGSIEIAVTYKDVTLTFTLVVELPETYKDGAGFAGNTVITLNDSAVFSFMYNGEELADTFTLTPVTDGVVTVDGATITAGATAGETVINVEFASGVTMSFTVVIVSEAEVSAIEPYFSIEDGVLFNTDMNGLVDKEALFGSADAKILAAKDGEGNPLTVTADGRILGVKATNEPEKAITLTIYTDVKSVQVTVKAYGLIIDQASDLAFFTMKQEMIVTTTADGKYYIGHGRQFAEGDVEFGGYYILANDIDATGYIHDWTGDFLSPSFNSYDIDAFAKLAIIEGKGLTGTFDGNGYSITNFGQNSNGLFGLVNGGTVKNVSISLLDKDVTAYGFSSSGLLGSYLVNGATVTDMYVQVNGSLNFGWDTPILANQTTADVSIKNVIAYWTGFNQPGAAGGLLTSARNEVLSDVYFINPYGKPVNVGLASKYSVTKNEEGATANEISLHKVRADAKYVDGVEQTGNSKMFYQAYGSKNMYSLDEYTIGSETEYSYIVLEGVKRYTSMDKFAQDTTNTFENFNSDVWEIVGGIPVFKTSIKKENISILADGVAIPEAGLSLTLNSSSTITATLSGSEIVPTISVVGTAVTISGNVITAAELGNATVKVSYLGFEWEYNVVVIPTEEAYAEDLIFSAGDGVLFDEDYNEVAFADIFGADVEVLKALDGNGNALTVGEDVVLGYDTTSKTDFETGSVSLYTATKAYKINVQVAGLIIDEATDLSFFQVKDVENYGKGQLHTNANINYAAGDITFDGYYKVVKDIDASEYTHSFNNGVSSTLQSFGLANMISHTKTVLKGMGLTGTFDGNGYTISGLTVGANGLFGFINGGTVKNVAFTNMGLASSTGILCAYAVNGATLSDLYFSHNGGLSGWNTQVVANGVSEDCNATRLVVDWSNNTHVTGAGGGMFGEIGGLATAMTDSYVITAYAPLFGGQTAKASITVTDKAGEAATVSMGNGLGKVNADAKYVDGVERSATEDKLYAVNYSGHPSVDLNTYNVTLGTTEITGPYDVTLLTGLKRYTTIEKMQADKANNDFSSWDSSIWTIVDGVPYFTKSVSSQMTAYVDGVAVSEQALSIGKNSTVSAIIKIGASELANKPTVEIVSGEEYISVSGNLITATAISGENLATVKITSGDLSWTQTIKVTQEVIWYPSELTLSASEGIFFNENGAQVNLLSAISGEVLSWASSDGQVVTVEDGKVLGIVVPETAPLELVLTATTAETIYKVNVKAVTLAIDEASDFAYFTIKKAWDHNVTTAYDSYFAEGDYYWDGYYMLVKNVDGTDYTHAMDGGLGTTVDSKGLTVARASVLPHSANRIDYLGAGGGYKGKDANGDTVWIHGFVGTFDGNGYTISNMTTNENGLFGVIGGAATIKNVGLINNNTSNNFPILAAGIAGSSKVSNVFVSTATQEARVSQTSLFKTVSSTISKMDNVVIIDNTSFTTIPNYTWSYSFGSFTTETKRDGANQAIGFGPSKDYEYDQTNVIIVSSKPMSASVAASTGVAVTTMDAQYIDGVLNEATYSVAGSSSSITLEADAIAGVRRYTSQDTLTADAGNISAQLNSLTESGYFNVVNGVITWKNAPVA